MRSRCGCLFQSTPSGGKATVYPVSCAFDTARFNPRLPGGRRLLDALARRYGGRVSIHAFRGEGDVKVLLIFKTVSEFQSTPSGGKATQLIVVITCNFSGFQSTPSGGKATSLVGQYVSKPKVSIHAFRGEGDLTQ